MADPIDQLLAQSDMEDAKKYTQAVRERLESENAEARKANNTLYTNLGLFSGGTVALSITYLGYLKSNNHPVNDISLLVATWACLLAAVPLSLFYTFLHNAYTYYARMREYFGAKGQQRTSEAEAALILPIINISSSDERTAETELRRKQAEEFNRQAEKCRKWEEFYYVLWKWGGLAAMLLFVVGLVLLFCFATANVR